MKTFYPGLMQSSRQTDVALCLMVNQLSVSTLPSAIRRRSHIINDIPAGFTLKTDQEKLATIIGDLLQLLISHTTNSNIRISTDEKEGCVRLHVEGNSRLNGISFSNRINKVQQLASKIGARILLNEGASGAVHISLSFMEEPVMA